MELLPFILGALVIGAFLGFVLGRTTGGRAPAVVAVLAALAAVGLMLKGRAEQGWDGMGYAIVSMLVAAPVALGVALGGWLGAALRARRAQDPRRLQGDAGRQGD